MSWHDIKGVWAETLNSQDKLVDSNIFPINNRIVHPEKGHAKRQCVRFHIIKHNNIGQLSCSTEKELVGCCRRDPFIAPVHKQKVRCGYIHWKEKANTLTLLPWLCDPFCYPPPEQEGYRREKAL